MQSEGVESYAYGSKTEIPIFMPPGVSPLPGGIFYGAGGPFMEISLLSLE
jgi:hypothetical protein